MPHSIPHYSHRIGIILSMFHHLASAGSFWDKDYKKIWTKNLITGCKHFSTILFTGVSKCYFSIFRQSFSSLFLIKRSFSQHLANPQDFNWSNDHVLLERRRFSEWPASKTINWNTQDWNPKEKNLFFLQSSIRLDYFHFALAESAVIRTFYLLIIWYWLSMRSSIHSWSCNTIQSEVKKHKKQELYNCPFHNKNFCLFFAWMHGIFDSR